MPDHEIIRFTVGGRASRWQRPEQSGRTRFTNSKADAGKKTIAWEMKKIWGGRDPWTGPVKLHIDAVFEIPTSWPRKVIAAAIEGRVLHIADPDIDQILKQIMDALKGMVYVDDNQVAKLGKIGKRYGDAQRTDIILELLPQQDDEITPGQRRLEKKLRLDRMNAREGLTGRTAKPIKMIKQPHQPDQNLAAKVKAMLGGNSED